MQYADHRELIDKVAAANGVSADVIMQLLDLEKSHSNLHGWGARPALRRSITQIVDAHLAAKGG